MRINLLPGISGLPANLFPSVTSASPLPQASDKNHLLNRLCAYSNTLPVLELFHASLRPATAGIFPSSWRDLAATKSLGLAAGFRFCAVMPQAIRVHSRYRDRDQLQQWLTTLLPWQAWLGAVYAHFPAFIKRDLKRLENLMQTLTPAVRLAVDFAHPSWQHDSVLRLLHRHNVALCLGDSSDRNTFSGEITANWGYLRFKQDNYSLRELSLRHAWLSSQSWNEAFVIFSNHQRHAAFAAAKQFYTLANLDLQPDSETVAALQPPPEQAVKSL